MGEEKEKEKKYLKYLSLVSFTELLTDSKTQINEAQETLKRTHS